MLKFRLKSIEGLALIKRPTLLCCTTFWLSGCFYELPTARHLKTIDISNEPQVAKLTAIADSIFYIPLETKENKLIGGVNKIVLQDDKIYVFDRSTTISASCYNLQGKLLFYINNLGLGPGEFMHPEDMLVVPDGGVLLYDLGKRSLIHFGSEGQYIDERNWNIYADQLCRLGESNFLVYAPDNNQIEGLDHSYIFLKVSDNKVNSRLKWLKYQEGLDEFYEPGVMNLFNDTVSLVHGFGNIIYYYANNTFGNRFEVNFGDKEVPHDLLSQGIERAEEEFLANNYASMLHQLTKRKNT